MQTSSQLEYSRQLLNNFKIEFPTMCPTHKNFYARLHIAFRCAAADHMTPELLVKTFKREDEVIYNIAQVYVEYVCALSRYKQLELLAILSDEMYDQYRVCQQCVSVTPVYDIFSQ